MPYLNVFKLTEAYHFKVIDISYSKWFPSDHNCNYILYKGFYFRADLHEVCLAWLAIFIECNHPLPVRLCHYLFEHTWNIENWSLSTWETCFNNLNPCNICISHVETNVCSPHIGINVSIPYIEIKGVYSHREIKVCIPDIETKVCILT